jgi:rare lipoprotein A
MSHLLWLIPASLLVGAGCAAPLHTVEPRSRLVETDSSGPAAPSATAAVRGSTLVELNPLAPVSLDGGAGDEQVVAVEEGLATWYGAEEHGGPTASGERFDMHALTAAHLTLPFQTRVRVTSLTTGQVVTVRINDRGPYSGRGRILDVSRAAAALLGMLEAGVVPVRLEVLARRPSQPGALR